MVKENNEISTNLLVTPQDQIQSHIYTIRGVQVMLDRDLAVLYQVETRRINEQVKRNSERFPERFMFQLSDAEFEDIKPFIANKNWTSQNATSNSIKMGVRRKPYAFTEQGVAMLATVLKGELALQLVYLLWTHLCPCDVNF